LMVAAIVVVPVLSYFYAGGAGPITASMAAKNIPLALWPEKGFTVLAFISTMAWGLGYFGQPHILARFMGIRSAGELPRSMRIAVIWVLISLGGAVAVGIISIPLFPNLPGGDHEKVFIYMINLIFNPWAGGVLLAAILSAIMSTIDSQLLVLSSTLTEDFYLKVIKKDASQKELVYIGRASVIAVSLAALVLALNPRATILGLVAYAWGGFGAAFGPLVICALYWRRTPWQSALAGMITGTVVLVLWKQMGMGEYLYEIVPGFLSNAGAIAIANLYFSQNNGEVLAEYDAVVKESRAEA
ncbi:MAG TPA: sodium/proline symporter, partial [Spirochaetes bacterium]|nr:sodium/proline symporter [Spirochaetota bacterium]